jgi:hypothetical protein
MTLVKDVTILFFYSEELLAPCPTPKLYNHPMSFVCGCLLNVFAATLHSWRLNPRVLHAVVTRDPPNMEKPHLEHFFPELPNIYLSRDIKSVM